MGRGIERRNIFRSAVDRKDFVERLASLTADDGMAIYAWVLMRNHFHLLCKTKQRPLSSSMRQLLTGYVVNFNKRHKRHGYLFQNRYKSIICQEDAYFTDRDYSAMVILSRRCYRKQMAQIRQTCGWQMIGRRWPSWP
jgi:putative transposase